MECEDLWRCRLTDAHEHLLSARAYADALQRAVTNAMSQPQPAHDLCVEREQIAESIRTVIGQMLSLHSAEGAALRKHDFRELERIDKELQKALVCESSLLKKFQAHLQSHGCQAPKALR